VRIEVDLPPPGPLKEILIPEHSTIAVVNHWDWPIAWMLVFLMVVSVITLVFVVIKHSK